jgi:hypothetical protein
MYLIIAYCATNKSIDIDFGFYSVALGSSAIGSLSQIHYIQAYGYPSFDMYIIYFILNLDSLIFCVPTQLRSRLLARFCASKHNTAPAEIYLILFLLF